MKNLIYILFGLIFLISCDKKVKSIAEMQTDFYELQKKTIRQGDSLKVNYYLYKEKVDSVLLLLDGVPMRNGELLTSENSHLGLNKLEIKVFFEDYFVYAKTDIGILNPQEEESVNFEVLKEFPHPNKPFTQGFLYRNGKIYESSGQYGQSKLLSYTPGANDFSQKIDLDRQYFAEGLTLFEDKLYQLTYRERKIFVYNPDTFELINTLAMPEMMREGWGITSSDKEFILSDGSQNLYFFDRDFNFTKKIQVAGNVSIYDKINELEYINGKVFANVWLTNYILVINPDTGAVEHYYDLSALSETTGEDDVLNGIALYNNRILVTGKEWSKIYELPLPEGF